MRELVAERRPDLLRLAEDAVGADPFERLRDGTAYLQPAIYCASLACVEGGAAIEPDLYAGHSMGELSALAAAGSLDHEDGLRLVAERGRLMQRAAEERPGGAMLAVGAGPDVAREIAGSFGLTVANDNSPEQVVLSGDGDSIDRARAEAKGRGLRASRLPIQGAFHSPLMEPVVSEFRAALDAVEFRPPRRPVLSCVTAAEFDDVRSRLAESLTHGVRWREVLLALHERGVRRFVESGPGDVLAKLVPRTLPGADAHALAELEAVRG
jgi:acyl transferase domain-containing protein